MMKLIGKLSRKLGWYSISNNYILNIYRDIDNDVSTELSKLTVYNSELTNYFESMVDHEQSQVQAVEGKFYFICNRSKLTEFNPENCDLEIVYDGEEKFITNNIGYNIILSDRDVFDNTISKISPLIKEFIVFNNKLWTNTDFGIIRLFKQKVILLFSDDRISMRSQNIFSRIDFNTGVKVWDFDLANCIDKLISNYSFKYPHKIKDTIGLFKRQIWYPMDNEGL
ncbi:MAG: hypothetical protein WBP41_02865, partial [Saprospiraceae bacterium]